MSNLTGWDALQDDNNGAKNSFTKFNAGEITQVRCLVTEPTVRWSHFIPSAKRSVTCLGKGCPICDARELAKAEGVDAKFTTSKKFAIVVYNYKTKQVEILEQGKAFFEQLYSFHTEIGDIGTYDIKVKRIGEKTNTTYTLIPCAPTEFKVVDEEGEKIEFDLPDLSKQFAPPTKEQMLALMGGASPNDVFSNNKKDDADEEFEV